MRGRVLLGLCAAAALASAPLAGTGGPALEVSAPAAFSPNGDGIRDEARISAVLDRPATITVEVLGPDGEPVEAIATGAAVPAGETVFAWAGAADGLYTVAVHAVDDAGAAADAQAPVRVDTIPPGVAWLRLPGRVAGASLPTTFRATDRSGPLRVSLLLAGRAGAGRPVAARTVASGSHRASWRLGRTLDPGIYRAVLRVSDDAGNGRLSAPRAFLLVRPVATRVYRRLDAAGRRVALTFDDCNDGGAWSRILAVLEARRVHAAFFCLGPQVGRYAAQARRSLRDGDAIGNHTWSHRPLPSLTPAEVRDELRRAESPWWRLARAAPMPYVRPPYGALDAAALAGIGAAGYRRTVLWDVDPQDWRRPGAAAIAERATAPARAGSIILLHVIDQTAAALPAIISRLEAKGLRPVGLDELFRAAGVR